MRNKNIIRQQIERECINEINTYTMLPNLSWMLSLKSVITESRKLSISIFWYIIGDMSIANSFLVIESIPSALPKVALEIVLA